MARSNRRARKPKQDVLIPQEALDQEAIPTPLAPRWARLAAIAGGAAMAIGPFAGIAHAASGHGDMLGLVSVDSDAALAAAFASLNLPSSFAQNGEDDGSPETVATLDTTDTPTEVLGVQTAATVTPETAVTTAVTPDTTEVGFQTADTFTPETPDTAVRTPTTEVLGVQTAPETTPTTLTTGVTPDTTDLGVQTADTATPETPGTA